MQKPHKWSVSGMVGSKSYTADVFATSRVKAIRTWEMNARRDLGDNSSQTLVTEATRKEDPDGSPIRETAQFSQE